MRLPSITLALVLATGIASAQKTDVPVDSVFDKWSGPEISNTGASGPAIVFQKQKTPGTTADGKTTHLWLRRDFSSGPAIMMGDQSGAVGVKIKNYTFLYGELMHDSTLRDMGMGHEFHGKVTFIFTDGDSITLQTYPITEDKFYPGRQNISFVILLNNQWPFPNDEMRKTFGIRRVRNPGETALRDKLKAKPLKQLRYVQSYAKRNEKGVAELHYAAPVITTYTEEEARKFQQAVGVLTKKVVDTRFP